MPPISRKESLTPEEKHARSLRAKRKFRAIVRLIIANLTWLQEVEDEKLGDNVRKNIQVLTRKKGKKSLLSLQDKAILNKPSELRTAEEKARLRKLISGLKSFNHFSSEVKDQMPAILNFTYFGPNRVILKQDYEPINTYCILSGEVLVTRTHFDRVLQTEVTKELFAIGPGNWFGEVSILEDINRMTTVTTTQASEFLYIRRDDFDRILRYTVQKMWNEIQCDMIAFSYFSKLSTEELREYGVITKKKRYKPDEIILSANTGQQDCVYFVVKGSCYLVEYLTIKAEYKNGISTYSLLLDEEEDDRPAAAVTRDLEKLYRDNSGSQVLSKHSLLRPAFSVSLSILKSSAIIPDIRKHFIKICTFNRLACFNLGENMRNRVVVANKPTECLIMPRYLLFSKDQFTFNTVAQSLKAHIPDTIKIFETFVEEKKWAIYKQQLFESCFRRKKGVSENSIHNVPFSIRLAEDVVDV